MSMQFDPIGVFHCQEKYPYDVARQGILSGENTGVVELFPGKNFEQALIALDGFTHLWILFSFHLNAHWKPMISPPRHQKRKVGVFASRAPYRPNPIGLSCVELLEIRGLQVYVRGHDLLDDTPVLDLKPYLRYADCHPDAGDGWLSEEELYQVLFAPMAERQLCWLEQQGLTCLRLFLINQLQFEPADSKRHRLLQNGENADLLLAYRTWRAEFQIDESCRRVSVSRILSGYSEKELQDAKDPYQDKALHHAFLREVFARGIDFC
ncbi:MAG: tRNA (N6-threonylcarbamoyladenosine(37)-N6)-methyltransferase TrmO [Lentisphaeria bacterium]|nr:tRNA (N6-threonylcarbamoyladenosine(37)-N6)-methyltransferase TrmO [Lentisphaeria bacterium]